MEARPVMAKKKASKKTISPAPNMRSTGGPTHREHKARNVRVSTKRPPKV